MSDSAENLLFAATHFSHNDWEYTRLHEIKHIRYRSDTRGYNRLDRRVRRAIGAFFEKSTFFRDGYDLRARVIYALIQLRKDANIPDGVVGGAITHWEEDGEYIQMVQPSVGELLARFLMDQPDNSHAVLIRAELDRIADRYRNRIKAGEVE